MRTNGWVGRPLLVVQVDLGDRYRALTGSHRYDAATKVPLVQIPCTVIDHATWLRSGLNFKTVLHLPEPERIAELRRGGLHDAADLCQEEPG